ncbi:MAG: recombinase family protein, partial [Candidatus Melainabacteria bacterium]|nr:recombinase family protein [Candidatus Melainabacteria bacterium]
YADEGVSGTKASRPELDRLMAAVEANQISAVIVYSFSRFARSVSHLLEGLQNFDQHGVSFISVSENLDTRTTTGRFVFTILAALSAMEREILIDRVKTGLVNARSKGIRLGRPTTVNRAVVSALLAQRTTYREIAKLTGASHWVIRDEVKKMKERTEAVVSEQKTLVG